jgi:hypothetical protein
MRLPPLRLPRRAVLLGLVGVAACDIARVAMDPTFPGLVQTWNFPATSAEVSVESLLPASVGLNADTTAFTVEVDDVNFNRRVGGYCPLCQALNGTTAPKPAFTISPDTGSTTDLPADVTALTVLAGGRIDYTLENGFSFDPLRVKADLNEEQGWLVIVVRSGSLVLGRDSVNGVDIAFPPTTTLARSIDMTSGNITSAITIDLIMDSPAGDPTFINANGLLLAHGVVSGLEVTSASINVPSATLDSGDPQELPKDVVPSDMIDRVVGGRLEMTMTNPFAVSGNMNVQFRYGAAPSQRYDRALAVPSGATPQVRNAVFDSTEMRNILRGSGDNGTTFSVGGAVSASTPIPVTPRQSILISNRLVLSLRAFGAKE